VLSFLLSLCANIYAYCSCTHNVCDVRLMCYSLTFLCSASLQNRKGWRDLQPIKRVTHRNSHIVAAAGGTHFEATAGQIKNPDRRVGTAAFPVIVSFLDGEMSQDQKRSVQTIEIDGPMHPPKMLRKWDRRNDINFVANANAPNVWSVKTLFAGPTSGKDKLSGLYKLTMYFFCLCACTVRSTSRYLKIVFVCVCMIFWAAR
jgi:hypothetical protein